jgi:predicted flap endonuclease-1-like 5' DNA nuclease
MRAQTRAYLSDIRVKRLTPPTAPEPEELEAPEATQRVAYVPDPHIIALTPSAEISAAAPPTEPREAAPVPAAAADTKAVLKELPLDSLRLLGQGMIWRLNNVGIHTLDELAASNPEQLGERLGPIGRLLRCEVWIQAARAIIAHD